MKKESYIQPIIEVMSMESEDFIATSLTDTNLNDLDVNPEPTDAEGLVRSVLPFEFNF